ncbi:MAG: glucose-1-phosphate thymidylyltransferase [bacterium]|nr:glucose-1-phosphate thymidylyltransferase [bacterium]
MKTLKIYLQRNLHPNIDGIKRATGGFLSQTVVLFEKKVFEKGFKITFGDATKDELKVEMEGEILRGASVVYAGAVLMDDDISIGTGTVVEPGALIRGPAIIGDNTEVRQGAYIRGEVVVGNKCVVGHTTEIKHSIMLGGSKAGHFAYIGDSILGRVNLGAGTKLANLKLDESPVVIKVGKTSYDTKLKKLGAIIGDGVEIGCNSVTNPGTLLGKGSLAFPNSTLHGYYPPKAVIMKSRKGNSTEGS